MFGEWLNKIMVKHNLTTKDVANATQSHQNVVRNWIRNKNYPNMSKFVMLVLYLERLGEDPAITCVDVIRLMKT